MLFSGVRISWLMLARNVDFALLSLAAALLASRSLRFAAASSPASLAFTSLAEIDAMRAWFMRLPQKYCAMLTVTRIMSPPRATESENERNPELRDQQGRAR